MSANKIDVEKKRAEEKKAFVRYDRNYTVVVITAAMMEIEKNCAIPAKDWRNMHFFRTEKCPFMETKTFLQCVQSPLLCKRTAGTDSCSHALCRTADDIFSPGTCIKAHTDDHKRKEEKEKCFINGSCRNFVII